MKHNISRPTKNLFQLSLWLFAFATTVISAQAALVARWSFEETSGNIAHDSTGIYHGTLSPNGATFVTGGISGNAMSLNKTSNGFVNFGNVLPFTTGDFTIVAWIKMQAGDVTDNSMVISKHEAYTQNGYFLDVNTSAYTGQPNKAFFYDGGAFGSGIAQAIYSTSVVNDGAWHQVVGVHIAGGSKFIYVDGAPAEGSNASQMIANNAAPLLLGANNFSGVPTAQFTGLIDELQIYNHALNSNEVDSLFQNPTNIILDCSQTVALLQTQLNAANATNALLQSQVVTLTTSNVVLRSQLGLANTIISNLQSQLNTANTTIGSLQVQLADANANIANLQAKLITADVTITSLQTQLAAANALNASLQNQLSDAQQPVNALSQHLGLLFQNPTFQIPGGSLNLQVSNIVAAIESLNYAQQQAFFKNLNGSKKTP